jgi:hypothetical protein
MTSLANMSGTWNHVRLMVCCFPLKHCKKKRMVIPRRAKGKSSKRTFFTLTYLLPLVLIASKVGCYINASIHCLKQALVHKRLSHLVAFAAADKVPYQVPTVRFDTDSFSIGVNSFALATMGNQPK